MGITLEYIQEFLQEMDYEFSIKEEDGLIPKSIVTVVNYEDEKAEMSMMVLDDGRVFRLQLEPFAENEKKEFSVPFTHKNIKAFMAQLLYSNFKNKFGSWEYKSTTGNVRFTVEIPLEDSEITKNQFARIINSFTTALRHQKEIKQALQTGISVELK